MSAHTPGPWSVPHFAKPETDCSCGYVLTDGLMGAVATVHCSGDGEDWQASGDNPRFAQAVANAHLIAAAPDLLSACKEAARYMDPMHFGPTVRAIDAAIAKATGGAP